MNFVFLLLEVLLSFLLLIIFYKLEEKEGLFHYISLMSALLGVIIYKSFDIFGFGINIGLSLIVGIFACSNLIIQKYGQDEVPLIIKSLAYPFIFVSLVLGLTSNLIGSEYNIVANDNFDSLFKFNINNIRIVVGFLVSMCFMLWFNSNIYYYLRKNKNNYMYSNIASMLIVYFFESVIFTLIAYIGLFNFNILVGMISVRYLLKVIVGIISLIPGNIIIKMKV